MTSDSKSRVAQGAGQAMLGRLGAALEALSMILFTWGFGVAAFGLYAALWSWMKILTGLTELAMSSTLQRYVPRQSAAEASATLGIALKASMLASFVLAMLIYALAPALTHLLNVDQADQQYLVTSIRIFVWIIPLWSLVELGTSAIRATRQFGPEVRVRVFYEQALRLLIAAGIWLWMTYLPENTAKGLASYGLLIAHLGSVALAAILTLRLVQRSYNLRAVLTAKLSNPIAREAIGFGLAVMPAHISKRLFSELPVILLNMMLPGATGAAASAYYAVARKIASVLQLVRIAFDYVIAPLAAEQDGRGDRKVLEQMVRFSTRLAVITGLPLLGALSLILPLLFQSLPAEMSAAIPITLILMAGRCIELSMGPTASLVEVLGQKSWPTVNAAIGLAGLITLSYLLIPTMGVEGAALAAASGLNLTAILALLESRYMLGIKFHGGLFWRYLALGIAAALPSAILVVSDIISPLFAAAIALPMLLVGVAALIRWGFTETDAAALGHIGRKLRGR